MQQGLIRHASNSPLCFRQTTHGRGEDVTNFERICPAIKYIEDHLDEKTGLEHIARVFHFRRTTSTACSP